MGHIKIAKFLRNGINQQMMSSAGIKGTSIKKYLNEDSDINFLNEVSPFFLIVF